MLQKYYRSENELDPQYMIEVDCPHCHTKRELTREAFELNGFTHLTCNECGCVYVAPRLKDECLSELYADEYYSEVYGKSMLPALEARKDMIGIPKCEQILGHRTDKKAGMVLDIGCGVGEVIEAFRQKKWDCYATEMNPVAFKSLQDRQINVFHGDFNHYISTKGIDNLKEKFDIVMAWGVIEHVVDPHEFLANVAKVLKPGGLFASEVPHSDCLLTHYCRDTGLDPKRILLGEQHILHYSEKAYCEIHEKAGLKLLHKQTNGLDLRTIFKEEGVEVSSNIIGTIQKFIDHKMGGDLIRGIWQKA